MKQVRLAIEERVAETAEADLQSLFTRKLPKKGFSEKWMEKNLEKYGAKLLTSDGWLRPIPQIKEGESELTTIGDLAAHLRLGLEELEWFSDLKNLNPAEGRLAHYRYRWIPKRKGGKRLLMEPKESLKIAQRRILDTILEQIPLHDAAHGFRKERSIRTYAEPHCGKRVVVRMDLADFFPSVTQARVTGLFRMLSYRDPVAKHLAGLCTHGAPKRITRDLRLQQRHLPQGAPTSPYLANAIAFRLDCRLSGLAKSAGLVYTRYADDLAFSGERITESFRDLVNVIILEEGFLINPRKTRVMTSSTRQRLAGVVVNEHPNVSRRDFDLLKAILHRGPSMDEKEILRGEIAAVQMVNLRRGTKLMTLFEDVSWK
ncbi:MAG: reverse transcriptase family protein [Akkermansiaceae bacterium]